MRGGQLRHLVNIEQPALLAADDYGQKVKNPTWPVFASGVWSQIEPIRAYEYEKAKSFGAQVSHRVTIRYLDGVTSKMRINFGGRLLSIAGVTNDEERDRMMILYCTENV